MVATKYRAALKHQNCDKEVRFGTFAFLKVCYMIIWKNTTSNYVFSLPILYIYYVCSLLLKIGLPWRLKTSSFKSNVGRKFLTRKKFLTYRKKQNNVVEEEVFCFPKGFFKMKRALAYERGQKQTVISLILFVLLLCRDTRRLQGHNLVFSQP